MTKTTHYKNTSIGLIPTEWKVKKLEEVLLNDRLGGNYDNSESNLGIPVIKMGNLDRGKISLDKIQYLPDDIEYNKDDILKYGDLLFNTRNTLDLVGKVAIWKEELPLALYNSNLLKLEFKKEKVSSNFFMNYLFNSQRILSQLKGFATGTTSVAAIYSRDIKKLQIPLPPLPEQQKIAEVLSTWDKAIQETDAIIKKLEYRNKALANKLFTENNWKTFRLSELFDRITDKNSEGNTTVTTISARHGFIRQEDFFNKTVASKDLSNYYLINKGDFCYNKSYSKGYDWGVVKRLNDFEKAVVTTLYICFRFKDKSQNADFWELYFENGILDKGLSKVAQEGGRAHGLLNVTSGDFFSIQVKVPSLEEQNAIAEILNTANDELKQYQQKVDTLKLQKKGLMQQLLTGKIRTV